MQPPAGLLSRSKVEYFPIRMEPQGEAKTEREKRKEREGVNGSKKSKIVKVRNQVRGVKLAFQLPE